MSLTELSYALCSMPDLDRHIDENGGEISPQLIRQIQSNLNNLGDKEYYETISRCVREYFLTEESIESGWGIKGAAAFIDWFDNSFLFNRKIKGVVE